MRALLALFAISLQAPAQQGQPLFNGRDLSGWQVRGDGIWTVLPGGVLLGQRLIPDVSRPFEPDGPISRQQYGAWLSRHA
jgi:hypothetical protein